MFLYCLAEQTQKLYLLTQCHMIILLKIPKHIAHRLSIDSFIPLSKQPTADVQSVLSSREHTQACGPTGTGE